MHHHTCTNHHKKARLQGQHAQLPLAKGYTPSIHLESKYYSQKICMWHHDEVHDNTISQPIKVSTEAIIMQYHLLKQARRASGF
jgi:hypothetical protein